MKPYVYIPVGKYDVLIDRGDYEWVRFLHLTIGREGYVYSSGKRFLHRMILGLIPGDNLMVDHINGNKLDNRRRNIRLCNPKQNQINRKPSRRNRYSYYKGVSYHDKQIKKQWCSSICYDGKSIYLGYWDREEDAALAYDKAARMLYPGEYKKLNFPEQSVINLIVPNIDVKGVISL